MRRILGNAVVFIALGAAVFVFRTQIFGIGQQLYARALPCTRPLSYSIGSLDTRFGISRADFLSAVKDAETIWEKPSGKNLFQYDPSGALKINLVYDVRQQTTDRLKKLGLVLDTTQASYDALKEKYDSIETDYAAKKAQFESAAAAFQAKQDAYNKQVQYWNSRGGAPRAQYQQLQSEQAALIAESAGLKQQQDNLNIEVGNINALADGLNQIARALNLNVAKYNSAGGGQEFEEGLYQSSLGTQEIDIYEFDSHARLVRVLAHEMGHALGLDHVDDKVAIMYRLNQSSNEKTSAADLAELTRVCSQGLHL